MVAYAWGVPGVLVWLCANDVKAVREKGRTWWLAFRCGVCENCSNTYEKSMFFCHLAFDFRGYTRPQDGSKTVHELYVCVYAGAPGSVWWSYGVRGLLAIIEKVVTWWLAVRSLCVCMGRCWGAGDCKSFEDVYACGVPEVLVWWPRVGLFVDDAPKREETWWLAFRRVSVRVCDARLLR